MWPKPRNQEPILIFSFGCSGLFFYYGIKSASDPLLSCPVWRVHWLGLWTFVWATFAVIPLMSNTHKDTHWYRNTLQPENDWHQETTWGILQTDRVLKLNIWKYVVIGLDRACKWIQFTTQIKVKLQFWSVWLCPSHFVLSCGFSLIVLSLMQCEL